MERTLLVIAMALMCAISISAQNTTPAPVGVSDECLLATDAEAWAAIGLTTAQVEKVEAIQTDCKTACAAVSETGHSDPAASKGALKKHRDRIRKVLTKEQYAKWLVWCNDHSSHTELMKKFCSEPRPSC